MCGGWLWTGGFGQLLNVKLALDRRFWAPLNVKMALDRRSWAPWNVKLPLDRQFRTNRRFRAPVGRATTTKKLSPGFRRPQRSRTNLCIEDIYIYIYIYIYTPGYPFGTLGVPLKICFPASKGGRGAVQARAGDRGDQFPAYGNPYLPSGAELCPKNREL